MNNHKMADSHTYALAGMFSLALRLVTGWTYFSAFWRRLILNNKLDPDAAGYIGEKFNHFLPNALFIRSGIEYLVSHPEVLWWFMAIFTIVEAVVGLLFMLGLFTRLMSIGVAGLAMGILLGAGWLGTTCLDEWQIGVLGVAAGFTVFLTGGGRYALDNYLLNKTYTPRWQKAFGFLGSGVLPVGDKALRRIAVVGAVLITALTLFTNQYFHGGVWGKLHNKSVRPHVTISNAYVYNDELWLTVFRDEGADVYGSFLIGVTLKSAEGDTVAAYDMNALANMPATNIKNKYVSKVKTGKHSLVLPLGAKASLKFDIGNAWLQPQTDYEVVLTDISGTEWKRAITIKQ